MFSKACEYALRAMIVIAMHSEKEEKIGIKAIADELKLPSPFLSKILQNLVKVNVLESTKGPNGGFYLNKKARKIPVIKIIEIIDGLHSFHQCGLGLKQCSEKKPCPIHHEFKPYRKKLQTLLAKKTIADLSDSITKGNAFVLN